MAQGRLVLELEVQAILGHIDKGYNFLLSGGAGSGKTYSLVSVVNQIMKESPISRVACITYTNAAVKEIERKVNYKNLFVSTIHDFLWDNIKQFQKELKSSLIVLMNDQESKIKNPEKENVPVDYFDNLEEGIQYKEYLIIKKGIISHNEIILVANYLCQNYPKLCDILKDKFQFIFIDEYQDTNKKVIEIFLTHFKQSEKHNIIGFFGDSMQSIYADGIGDLNNYKEDIKEVIKAQNRRNPKVIIDFANKLRIDNLEQKPSEDKKAPNMALNGKVKKGGLKFYYSDNNNIDFIKKKIGWIFEDNKEVKILNLTHNLIAPKVGFSQLMNIYSKDQIIAFKNTIKNYIKNNVDTDFLDKTFGEVIQSLSDKVKQTPKMKDFINSNLELYRFAQKQNYNLFSKIYLDKDSLVDGKKQDSAEEEKKSSKRDDLIKHLFKIQNNIFLYNSGQFNEFIRVVEYKINSVQDKVTLKENIETLNNTEDKTIEDIINKADEYGICLKDDKLNKFIADKNYVYHRVKQVKFAEFQKMYAYLEGYTPFSTQHNTKGNEFDNVLVILDNGGWNHYNFVNLFVSSDKGTVQARTKKIFYVCSTRSKENLAVFFHKPSDQVIEVAQNWFGEGNVCKI